MLVAVPTIDLLNDCPKFGGGCVARSGKHDLISDSTACLDFRIGLATRKGVTGRSQSGQLCSLHSYPRYMSDWRDIEKGNESGPTFLD